jgi:hypothetical protein
MVRLSGNGNEEAAMSDLVPQTNHLHTREAIRRLKASIGAASGFDEIVVAVQTALGTLFPWEQASPAFSARGGNQSAFASLPSRGLNRWISNPTPPASRPLGGRLVRTGELTLEPATTNPNLVRTGELILDPPPVDVTYASDDPTEPLVPAPVPVDAGSTLTTETAVGESDSRARWRAVTQLMTLLLAGQEPAQLLPAALRLSIQTFNASGALIHLNAEDIVPGERGFALGDAGFEAALRATARQRRGTSTVESSETLAGRYPYRLIVPIRSASGDIGKYALFRATGADFDADDREDASAVATLLAVALHQSRLARS